MRRTPLIALLLAPFVLYAVVMAWNRLLLPLSAKLWRSEFSVRTRVVTGNVPMRIQALRDAAGVRAPDAALIGLLVHHAQHDPAQPVRVEAWRSLGFVGARQALPAAALAALGEAARNAPDDAALSAAFEAVGQVAAKNRIGDDVVLRIAQASDEKHLAGLYPRAIAALAGIGAAQPLPETVFATLRAAFEAPRRPGQREDLARAFETIAKGGGRLPPPVLEALGKAFAEEPRNTRVRVHALYALAHSAAHYPQAKAVLVEATRDGVPDVRRAAEHGLRIVEAERLFAQREPMAVALDRSLPVESRLKAMGPLKVNRTDAAWRAGVLALARDADPRIAVAALGLFKHVEGGPDDAFDREQLLPQLDAAMRHADPQVRRAAYRALADLLREHGHYRSRVGDFRAALEAGAQDPEPPVRVVALAIMIRTAPGQDARDALLERALGDADPYVRRNLVGWLASPRTETGKREALLARARADSDPDVRRAAEAAEKKWQERPRSWPVEAWELWQAGEHEKLGLIALTAVTVAAPIIVGLVFFVYYMARLLTYLYQRRWRALAVVAVMAVWAAAAHGMFLLYFMAAHAGSRLDLVQTLQLAGILWIAIALYAALGWGLHYAVRR
jgi:HEAT repeats